MKLPRTIRLDPSDAFVFEPAAEPGEWAVPGTFLFWNGNPDELTGKARQAFRSGFLGVDSFGWSTLVSVSDVAPGERAAFVDRLAQQLVARLGAPDLASARAAAEEEVEFAASLCDHPVGTILAVQRVVEDGETRERFRTLHRREGARVEHAHAFAFVETDEDDDGIEEHVDLLSLGKGAQ